MANEQNTAGGVDPDFNKSEDKQTPALAGVGDGVDFNESLPGGGEENDQKSAIIVGDEEDSGFDARTGDDPKS